MKKLVISVLGQDRPGILAAVSEVVSQRRGNIENLSQTLLQSVFGAILMVSVPEEENSGELQQALSVAGAKFGLAITVHDAFPERPGPSHETQPYIVAAIGPDQQGLISSVAGRLAAHEVNIINMRAIYQGEDEQRNFMMIFEVDVPRHTVMQKLRDELREIARQQALDISIQHRGIFDVVSNIQN